ncbi:nitrilase family protein [Robertkochia flava]|uniref:nitrilase family protein n=1 Tax=Robertkochia flava TaxID=3447986 RepID=UPI001CCC3EF0|nr:nitrilase family protein [Robertkochia marina]
MENLKLALVQADLIWENVDANRRQFQQRISEIDRDIDLIVLPEMFSSGFTMHPERVYETMEGPTLEWMKDLSKQHGAAICGSLVIREGEVFRNRFLFVHPEGKVDYYDKRHSFTYAGEDKKYKRGDTRKLILYKGWKIFPQVCYDLRFPVFSRNDMEYDLLIYVANWPEIRIDAWDTLLKARAIENMAYSVGVNRIGKDGNDYAYPGHSGAYDELGKTLVHTSGEEVVYVSLNRSQMLKTRAKLRFLEDRDLFNLK